VIRDLLASVVGLSLVIVGIVLKARQEEALLTAHFGEAYREYQAEVPALFPGLW
jgi:protein-S-isoprenylcysteine O-methyltransferase Ste14